MIKIKISKIPFQVIKIISHQILSHREGEGNRESRVRDEHTASQVSSSELTAQLGAGPEGELVGEVDAVKLVQV